MNLADVYTAIGEKGLVPRGAFHPRPKDRVPSISGGVAAGTIVLVGNAGPTMWSAFRNSRESARSQDPLDHWSRRVIGALAEQLDCEALFPFEGPPFLPFQRWAQRAETVFPSPLGMSIHPVFGLWHAYRGALAFAGELDSSPTPTSAHPCDDCPDQPCLHTCPVDAVRVDAYDAPACARHIRSLQGIDCLHHGCRARRACPVGRSYQYSSDQAEFHMRAFLHAQLVDEG